MLYQILENPKRIHYWDDKLEGFVQYDDDRIQVSYKKPGRGYRWKIKEFAKDDPGLQFKSVINVLKQFSNAKEFRG